MALLLGSVADAQRPVVQPESIEGAWETATPTGIHGVFVNISTHAQGSLEQPVITNQSFQFRIYHRRPDGYETWGWYGDSRSVSSIFDGRRLIAAGLDVGFQSNEHRWSGTWSLDGETRQVVLESPRPASGSQPNVLCGEWQGPPGLTARVGFARLHIVQSSDGTLTAWEDRTFSLGDQRHGILVDIKSPDSSDFVMEEVSGVCCAGRFEGVLSSDGATLSGNWTSLNMSQAVPQSFRRVGGSQLPNAATPQVKLSPKIPRANIKKYRSIQDAKDWRNPILVIRANGIEVIAKGIASGSKTIAVADLTRTLVKLPVDAWPYGRVVAAEDLGLRSTDGSDDDLIRQNHAAAERVLKNLEVEVDWWPSA